ncbi:MAG: AraC family transcriptional regulator [Planctomycetota bacterium]|jgi:AraC-like DNA-binding protein
MQARIQDSGKVPQFFSKQVLEAHRFYLDASGRSSGRLAVVCGGCEHCGPEYGIDRKDFPFYSIEFVARGKGTLTLSDQTVDLFPGRVFSYGPGVAHRIEMDADDPLVKYFVDFTGRRAEKLLETHGLAPGAVVQVASPDAVLHVFDDLIANGAGGGRYGPLITATLVELLILKIAEAVVVDDAYRTVAFSTYQSCREYIRSNSLELRTLEEVAEACHVDEAYLCRLFSRFDNQSPYQYLMQLKMAVAAQRLQREGVLIKEVAYELGFSDPFHFSRAFKKVFGLSPAAFRKLR